MYENLNIYNVPIYIFNNKCIFPVYLVIIFGIHYL